MKLLVLLIYIYFFIAVQTYWRFLFNFSLCVFLDAQFGCTFPLSHEFEQFGSVHRPIYLCTKEIYRPQRDSNRVSPGSESTTLPMSYPDAT